MKKFLCVIISVMMLLSMAACAKSTAAETTAPKDTANNATGETPETTGTAPSESVAVTEPVDNRPVITVGMPVSKYVISLEENALTRWIEETLNVRLEFTEYAGGSDIGTQLTTTVNIGQELPDILYGVRLEDAQLAQFMKDGYFWDVTPYFENEEGATVDFWTRIREKLTEDQQATVVKTITDAESGKIMGVPTVEINGNEAEAAMTCKLDTFITKDCEDPDLAFEILMLMWSQEGSLRVRFGEPNVNWSEADPQPYKVLSDPLTQQNTAHWGTVACCFVEYVADEAAENTES